MTRRRGTLVLTAVLAALSWAPSSASAAAPNVLLEPMVTPAHGTTATVFTLSVHYRSDGGGPPTAVRAEIGGLVVALARTSGEPADGRWTGSTRLPAGTWPVVFAADAEGPSPRLDGPTITVAAGGSPADKGSPQAADASPAAGDGGPAPSLAPATPESKPTATDPMVAAAATPEPLPAASAVAVPAAASAVPVPAASAAAAAGSAPASAAIPAASVAATPEPDPGLVGGEVDGTGSLVVLLAVVLSAASVALLSTGWLLGGRDRPAKAVDDVRVALGPRRRARLDEADDPILAGLGLRPHEMGEADRERGRLRSGSARRPPAPRD